MMINMNFVKKVFMAADSLFTTQHLAVIALNVQTVNVNALRACFTRPHLCRTGVHDVVKSFNGNSRELEVK